MFVECLASASRLTLPSHLSRFSCLDKREKIGKEIKCHDKATISILILLHYSTHSGTREKMQKLRENGSGNSRQS